jgi:hypothetical protein
VAARDSSWLDLWRAVTGPCGSVMWPVGTPKSAMRQDNAVSAFAWVKAGTLAVGGPPGLHLFAFFQAPTQPRSG